MKVTVNSNGFTLVEVLAVIAILAIIVLLFFTNVFDFLKTGKAKSFDIQKNNIIEAAEIYLKDYCEYPINSTYVCDENILKTYDEDGFPVFNGIIQISVLENANYIEEVYFNGNRCNGTIEFINSKATINLNCTD